MINIRLSEGFGNNLFQALMGEYLASLTGLAISVYGADSPVAKLYDKTEKSDIKRKSSIVKDRDFVGTQYSFSTVCDHALRKIEEDKCVNLQGNFEYYELFDAIKINRTRLSIFSFDTTNRRTGAKPIRIHVRLNNRLVQANHALNWVCPKKLLRMIKQKFPQEEIELISDFPFKSDMDFSKRIDEISAACRAGPNAGAILVPKSLSMHYIHAWREQIEENDITVAAPAGADLRAGSGALTVNFLDDFYRLQDSKAIFLWGSTFSYLASKFALESVPTFVVTPWKKGKKNAGPFLDQDPSVDTFKFSEIQYKCTTNSLRLWLGLFDILPYSLQRALQRLNNLLFRILGSR